MGLASLVALASGCGRGGAETSEEEIGVARIAIMQAPADTRCVRITVTGSRTVVSSVDVTPGQATAFTIGGLPLGNDSFTGEAFGVACAMLTPSAVAAWIGDAVSASVVVDPPVSVTLVLRRNGRANVGVDFQDDPDGGAPATGGATGSGGAMGLGGAMGVGGATGSGGAAAPGPITFAPAIVAPLPSPIGPMVSADFNHDGIGDLVFATSTGALFLVSPTPPAGLIGAPQQIAQLSPTVRAIVAGDFNGDGTIDLAVALTTSSPALLSGIPGGGFAAPTLLGSPPLAVLATGDVDGDGITDIVGVSVTAGGFLITQRMGTQLIFNSLNGPASAIAVADLDGDGPLDVALLSGTGGPSVVTPFLQRSGGTFSNGPQAPVPFPAAALAAADFDGDGSTDLAVAGVGGTVLLFGASGGQQLVTFQVSTFPATAVVAADFNGDGRADLASLGTAQVVISRSLGRGMFDAPQILMGGPPPLAGLITATLAPGARPSLVVGSVIPALALLRNTSP